MKKLIVLGFIILNMPFLFGQNMLLKKITSSTVNNYHLYDYYKYNADWKLDSIIEVNEAGDTIRLFLYDNDSLKAEIQPSSRWTFNYYGDDSIVEFTSSQTSGWNTYKSGTYYINSDFEMSSYKMMDMGGNYLWTIYYTFVNGNCTEILQPDGLIETMDYSTYINPYLNEKKYFRRAFQGSVNFMETGDFLNSYYELVVHSSLNNFPVKVDFYIDNELFITSEYEYYDFTSIGESQTYDTHKILDISYFNLLGQKIEKPVKGFYIERIINTKGAVSQKKFAY